MTGVQHTIKGFFFFFDHVARGILVPRPGVEPVPPALEARSLNHRTAKGSPNKGKIDSRNV